MLTKGFNVKDPIAECFGAVEEPEGPFSVLVADDEPYIRSGLKQLLAAEGYQVAIAGGGEEAILQLTENCYDLLVLDLGMPGVGGAAVLDFIAERRLDMVALVISGTTSVREATTALSKGAMDYLRKPFSPEEFLDHVAKARRTLRQIRARRLMCSHLETSERLHRFIVNYSPDLIFVLDAAGHFTYLNQRVPGLLGFEIDALTGQPFAELIDAADREKAAHLLCCLSNEKLGEPQFAELRLLRNATDSQQTANFPLIAEVTALAIRDDDDPAHFIGSYIAARDVSERRRAEEALQRTSMRLEHVVSASPTVVYSRDPGPGMPVTFISSNVYELLGYYPDELLADRRLLDRLIHPEDRSHCEYDLESMATHLQTSRAYRLRHNDGSWRWIRDTARLICDAQSQPVELVGSWLDNTEAQLLAEQLTHQASHDALTGLSNRRAFEQRLQRALDSARDQFAEHALFYLDLDQFKVINDTCGHLAGDDLLRQLARVLQIRVRKQDILARLGGDEFGVLMEYCPLHDAMRVANTLCQAVNDFRFTWSGKTFRLGVSIGVVAISAASDTFSGVLSAADSACYAAKDAGRNRVHLYTEDDAELAQRQGEMQWVARINQALEEKRFQLAFQPIVPILGVSKGHHYELLLRMEGESGQILMPGAFLPAAERYHLAAKLDQWVVSTALDWLSSNPQHLDHLALCAINLSGHSLGDEYLLEYLVDRLAYQPLLAEKLCFEITETAAIANLGSALHFIQMLKEIGCRFALDDFGSGLSSFAYLKKLPVDFLKIDGMFVEDIVSDPVSLAMVNSINQIGHVMGMETIAEFVKDEHILTKLRLSLIHI